MSGSGLAGTDPRQTISGPVGTLLSVNVGMPKDVPWQGKTVFTGVFKEAVTGPRRVRKLNVDGDGQGDLGGHGGEQRAVFVYQIDSYRYWERELGRDDFVYGQFGENFTVEGLADDEVCIGDRFRIGTAVFDRPRTNAPITSAFNGSVRNNLGVRGNSLEANVSAASRTCGISMSSSPSAVCTLRARNPLRNPLS
jgi:MOSC domain-containing protein YiiM